MDLVASIRKEGSRGGRDSFKWSDVKESSHRENYLGHSLMAPVGRWQQGRDLNWYAKNKEGDSEEAAEKEKQERAEELRRVKEAEQEAMAQALGLPVAPRSSGANLTPLGGSEVRKTVRESTNADDKDEEGRGIGFGSYGGLGMDGAGGETLAAVGVDSQSQSREQGRVDRERGSRGTRSRRDRSRETDRRRDRDYRDRGHKDRGDRHGRDRVRDGNHGRSDHRHRREREHRQSNRHRSRSPSRSSRTRSPRREHRDRHREDSRERRRPSDSLRDDSQYGHRPSSLTRHGRPGRDAEKDNKHSDHYSQSDRHPQSRRDRDSDRSHRDRRR